MDINKNNVPKGLDEHKENLNCFKIAGVTMFELFGKAAKINLNMNIVDINGREGIKYLNDH